MLKNIANITKSAAQVQLHVDGLFPLKNTLCTILGRKVISKSQTFIADLLIGAGKPKIVHEYVHGSINELQPLTNDVIMSQHNEKLKDVQMNNVVADAPAKTLPNQVKQQNGYASCFFR